MLKNQLWNVRRSGMSTAKKQRKPARNFLAAPKSRPELCETIDF